jgi:hypothetical protein
MIGIDGISSLRWSIGTEIEPTDYAWSTMNPKEVIIENKHISCTKNCSDSVLQTKGAYYATINYQVAYEKYLTKSPAK